jgi:NADPH:quinone reductase-like Zn-dependent oxidoreductase
LKALSLGAEAGINYKTEDFAARVLELTGGRGVDIILDCVGGSYALKNIEALAVDGRYHVSVTKIVIIKI